ncbi:MAG: hypothetical protein IK115_08380 [Lachnospiraceae bacterium]|nr:hypothetical protein [Lachnospiraceae bacterium]
MSRDFESEYQQLIRDEAPDFWGAIEAKLDAQEKAKTFETVLEQPAVTAVQENTAAATEPAVIPFSAAQADTPAAAEETMLNRPVRKKSPVRWQLFALPAAAVLCAALILPVMLHSRNAMETSAPDMAAGSAVPQSLMTDGALYTAEANFEEAAEAATDAEESSGERQKNAKNSTREETTTDGAVVEEESVVALQPAAGEEKDDENAETDGELPSSLILNLRVSGDVPEDFKEILQEEYGLEIITYDKKTHEYSVRSVRELNPEEEEALEKALSENPYVEEIRREGKE